jgi:hypothetical protein
MGGERIQGEGKQENFYKSTKMIQVNTTTGLVKAVIDKESVIEIEGNLVTGIVKIKATGEVAWVIAIGAIGIAAALLIGSGGSAAVIATTTATAAIAVIGYKATVIALEFVAAVAFNAIQWHLVSSQQDLAREIVKLATGQSVLLSPLYSLRDDYELQDMISNRITLVRK